MKLFTTNYFSICLATCSVVLASGAMAQNMPKAQYKADKEKISIDYKSAREACNALSDNAKDICVAQAKGQEKIAHADLEAAYKPSQSKQYKARVAKAEAAYDLAKQRCDDLTGNPKAVCITEAKAAEATAKADAKVQKKTSQANTTASGKVEDARSEAADDKVTAQYKVAKEKCDVFAGPAKDKCMNDAKTHFGKQ